MVAITIHDPNTLTVPLFDNPNPFDPFSNFTVDDGDPLNSAQTVTVTLTAPPGSGLAVGTLSDPVGTATFAAGVLTESGALTGTPTFATNLLQRLVYTAPTLAAGSSYDINVTVSVANNTVGTVKVSDANTVIDLVTAPLIQHTTPSQPVTSGTTISPFAEVLVTDTDFDSKATDSATIKITDGGVLTDADGLLKGGGLTQTGTGTYTISGYTPTNLYGLLDQLSFQTAATVPAGQVLNPVFELDVKDDKSGLTSTDTTTSLKIPGPIATPTAPLIAGAAANQTVTPGNFISPFRSVTISDGNANAPTDTIAITVTDANGVATDGDGSFAATTGLTKTGTGTYTLAAAAPAAATKVLDGLTFVPAALAAGQTSLTTDFVLGVTSTNGLMATDKTTSIVEQAAAPPQLPNSPPNPNGPPSNPSSPPNNFQVVDETSGQTYASPGETYSGPVSGITSDIVLTSADNLNITAMTPNVFIHSGSGQDGLTALSGNNILDGSTNSNFLTGGSGHDTFYLDDRAPASPIFSTIANFHSGDDVTVFGVKQGSFNQVILDNQGAAGFKGVDLLFQVPNQQDTSFVLAGFTSGDLSNGKITASYGHTQDTPGAPGADYVTYHAT